MKRDMELIRLILLNFESPDDLSIRDQVEANYTTKVVNYQLVLLIEQKLLLGHYYEDKDGDVEEVHIERITWEGHDLLDSMRDPKVWKVAKDKVLAPGVSFTFELLKDFLKAAAKQSLNFP